MKVMHVCNRAREKQPLGLAGFAQAKGRMSGHTGNTGEDQSKPVHLGAGGLAGQIWALALLGLGLGLCSWALDHKYGPCLGHRPDKKKYQKR